MAKRVVSEELVGPRLFAGGEADTTLELFHAQRVDEQTREAVQAKAAEPERVAVAAAEADREQAEQELQQRTKVLQSQLLEAEFAEQLERNQQELHELARQVERSYRLCEAAADNHSFLITGDPDLRRMWEGHQ